MSELVLGVRVAEAALRETGDASDRVGENIVNVLLACPRPGKAEGERIEVVEGAQAPIVLAQARLDELAASGDVLRTEAPLVAPLDLGRPREKARLGPLRGNGHLVLEIHVTA
jgi:hypothetical protein